LSYINHGENEAKDDLSKEFSTVNVTGTPHEDKNPASYMMMIIIIIIMDAFADFMFYGFR
jgi:hypothetical protein